MRAIKLPVGQANKTEDYLRIYEDMFVIKSSTDKLNDDDLIDVAFNQLGHEKCTDFDTIINRFWKRGKLTKDERDRVTALIVLLYCDYYRI